MNGIFLAKYLMSQKMKSQLNSSTVGSRVAKAGVTVIFAAVLSACANYAGIHSDKEMAQPQSYATEQSLPAEQGHWPAADWADQFGDAQLKALLDEAFKSSPTLEQARARVAAAAAYSETARANTLPQVGASYSYTRQQFSSNALVPPPYAGSWQSENKALVTASYDLDLWGKNREALKAALSQLQASQADAEVVKLTLNASIARTYNQLAPLYALRDIAQQEIEHREHIDRITAGRIATGLDTEVERKTAQANLATSRATLPALDGRSSPRATSSPPCSARDRIAACRSRVPSLGIGDEVRLPDNLPADLVSRRPDIVAARWRVDAIDARRQGSEGRVLPGHQPERGARPRCVRLRAFPHGGEPHDVRRVRRSICRSSTPARCARN